MKITFLILCFFNSVSFTWTQVIQYETQNNIPYYNEAARKTDQYINEQCVLDIYYPANTQRFATIVWFHGGGLTEGNKEIASALQEQGFCIVAANYRLAPKVNVSSCIADAAAAVAWVFEHIASYGGDPGEIFVSGYSAGGYLSMMVGLDNQWLNTHRLDANRIAGLISLSGQTITHLAARKEQGIDRPVPYIDALAPLYHVRMDAPPLILITGDRELELMGRYEENAYMMRMMTEFGHEHTSLYELDGYDHNMTEPAFPLLVKEVRRLIEDRKK